MTPTVLQIRMARAALRFSQADIAARAGISKTAFNDLEAGSSSPRAATLSAIQDVLEREGAEFAVDGSDEGLSFRNNPNAGPGNPDEATLQAARAILAAGKKARSSRGGLG